MRQAEIVKQPPERKRKANRVRKASEGQQTVERYVERLLETAERLRQGPEAAELLSAAAELFEGTVELEPARATELYGRALDSFDLSRQAHLGLRRLARQTEDTSSTIAALQREIANATGQRSRSLRTELARTLLYQADQPAEALLVLEELEEERKALRARQKPLSSADGADAIKRALEGGTSHGEGAEKQASGEITGDAGAGGSEGADADADAPDAAAEEVPDWMGIDRFFLWEEALWATGQWRRYEEILRMALSRRHDVEGLTALIERRLLHLYMYILPDDTQAEIIIEHLVDHSRLDPELVEHALRRRERDDEHEAIVELLTRALAEPACATHETTYRMLLADVARHHFDDLDHATDIVRTGVENHGDDAILIHELLALQEERGDFAGLVDALGCSLEVLEDPSARADVLHRIGSILLDELELPDAAEEVFEEANAEHPTHRPTLRSLGRLYQAREDWRALVKLYETEIETSDDPDCWRKTLTLAELYEERLDQPEKAFAQYASALETRPAYLPALKGASRLAARLGCWTELLKLYAAAEAATEDQRQRVYLLERIAQIAEEHLGDLQTARTALVGLRAIEPRHPGALSSLARLSARLGEYEDLVALTDEEFEWTEDVRSRAALLVRNAEICEEALDDPERAESYHRRALEEVATYLPALEGLGRLLQRQERWQDLVDMGLEEADAWGEENPLESTRRLHVVADILERQLDRTDEAIEIYWRCLDMRPEDRVARDGLQRLYRKADDWEKVCEVLEIEAEHGGKGGHPAATLFRLGQIREHRLEDDQAALDAYRRAFLAEPGNPVLLRAWLAMARKLDELDGPRKVLTSASSKPASPQARAELLVALAEFSLSETRDPLTAAGFLEVVEDIDPARESAGTLLAMALARSGRWNERVEIALKPQRHEVERCHGANGALVLGAKAPHDARIRDVLDRLGEVESRADEETILSMWSLLPPDRRPDHDALPARLRRSSDPLAQDLRRWATVRALADGEYEDPSKFLLPRTSSHGLTLRPDMELLAAHYEVTSAWPKLLEVLAAQEAMAPTNNEAVRISLERARVLERTGRDAEALNTVRDGFSACDWSDPVRDDLYDYLEEHEDWERLVTELRRHLMHVDEPAIQSELWRRLSRALETGLGDLDDALRALDAAYRCFPDDGSLLPEIARVAEDLGEVQIARRALDDYLAYHRPEIERELETCVRFVELHINHPGGDAPRVIDYLEDLVRRSADDRRALEAFAEAHAAAGSPYVAAEVLMRLARLPYREDELQLWLRLGELYAHRMGERDKAEKLLWELLTNFPESEPVWKAIDDFYRDRAEREVLVSRLRELVDNGDDLGLTVEQRRHFLGIMGRILGDELGQWRSARVVYSEAIELAAEVAKPDLSRKRAWALVKIPGEASAAYRGFCELLAEDPFQSDVIEAALDITDRSEAWDRSRILRQLAALAVPSAELHLQDVALRPKIDVTRDLADAVLEERLLHPRLRAVYDVLHEALPLIESVFKDDIPRVSVVGGKRVRGRSEIAELFNGIGARLGLGTVKIFMGNDESPLPMVFSSPLAFWIPSDRWDGMDQDERRHWAGYAAGLLWTGLASLTNLDGRDVWQLLDGIYYSVTGDGLEGRTAYTIEAAEKVRSPWYRRARKEITSLLETAGPAVASDDASLWGRWLMGTGDRAGLLFSGNLGTSVNAMLAGEGWREELTPDRLRRHFERDPRVQELIEFALSEDYLHLRYASGLSQKPSRIIG